MNPTEDLDPELKVQKQEAYWAAVDTELEIQQRVSQAREENIIGEVDNVFICIDCHQNT